MNIGVPKEIKNHENRVGLTPAGAASLVQAGNKVTVETKAGVAAGFDDQAYLSAGAKIADAKTCWRQDLVIKVKEPLTSEYAYLHPGLILYTYLHLAANPDLTAALLKNRVTAIGYETMAAGDGSLPALTPMSQVAGCMAVMVGGEFLQSQNGGKGTLLASIPGVAKCQVTVIGGGVVGENAAKTALGLGAAVTVLDVKPQVLTKIDREFSGRVQTLFSNPHNLTTCIAKSDLVIGAVLIAGAKAPKIVTEKMIKQMAPGSVVVDIPVDQGGIFETTTHATDFDHPTYVVDGVIHYAVANIPGAVAQTATEALTAVTTPYAQTLAKLGVEAAAQQSQMLYTGINTYAGDLVNEAVAISLDLPYTALSQRL